MEYRERRKLVNSWLNTRYVVLKPNGDGDYHKNGRSMDLRSLLYFIQGTRERFDFDITELDQKLGKTIVDIVDGTKTVRENDWNPNGEWRAKV